MCKSVILVSQSHAWVCPGILGAATQTWAAEDSAPYSSIPAALPPLGGGGGGSSPPAWDATFWFCPGDRRRDTNTCTHTHKHSHAAVIRLVGVLGLCLGYGDCKVMRDCLSYLGTRPQGLWIREGGDERLRGSSMESHIGGRGRQERA